MENYKLVTNEIKYLPKYSLAGMRSSGYDLNNYRAKYNHISRAESMYNNFIKFIPRGSHLGKYRPLK